MAVVDISVTQDNLYNGSNYLPVHSPLVFLIDIEESVSHTINFTYVKVKVNGVLDDTLYRTIPYKDIDTFSRQYYFNASEILRQYMPDIEDTDINEGVISTLNTTLFELVFYTDDILDGNTDTVEFYGANAAAQFGDRPNLYHIFFNDASLKSGNQLIDLVPDIDTYLCPEGEHCYVYFWNDSDTAVLTTDYEAWDAATTFDGETFTTFDGEILIV